MGYTQFVIWAGKQGFKYGQKYLNKAWQEATKGGKVVLESQFPKLVNKAKDLYKNFKTFDPKVVSKTDQLRRQTAIRDLMKDKPGGYKLSEEQIRQYMIGRRTALKYDRETALRSSPWDKNLWGPTRVTRSPQPPGPGKVIPFPKKPPGKADGGRIDKPLPTRSRDI